MAENIIRNKPYEMEIIPLLLLSVVCWGKLEQLLVDGMTLLQRLLAQLSPRKVMSSLPKSGASIVMVFDVSHVDVHSHRNPFPDLLVNVYAYNITIKLTFYISLWQLLSLVVIIIRNMVIIAIVFKVWIVLAKQLYSLQL